MPAHSNFPGQLPDYQVRESARARHVRLQVAPGGSVTVVVPRGFDHALLPALLRCRQDWLNRAIARLQAISPPAQARERLPARIELLALGRQWQVEYHLAAATPVRLDSPADGQLRLSGAIYQADACREALRDWLAAQAKDWLPRQVADLGTATGLRYQKITIKKLRSRWGSCSARGNLNLNDKLLFLPPALARYVLLHELCHTIHLNHSPRFWALMEKLAPDSRAHDRAMRSAWQYVPGWVEQG